ncbi:MAG: hypothetical protein GY832_19690 [Chloroflexi bacterium]|nr:hypothetical protein [Chloroflexota bacterium]
MPALAIGCLVVSLLPFSIATEKYFSPKHTVLSDRFRTDSIMINAIIGGTMILLSVIFYAIHYHHENRQVDLYADGFVSTDWLKSLAFRWDDVTEVYTSPIYRNTSRGYSTGRIANWIYTVHRNDGKKTKLSGLQGVSALGKVIQSEVSKRALPKAVDAYQAGDDVRFGPQFSVSQQGLRVGGNLLPWNQVAKVNLGKDNAVTILKKGKRLPWKRIGGHKMANPLMFQSMLYKISNSIPSDIF